MENLNSVKARDLETIATAALKHPIDRAKNYDQTDGERSGERCAVAFNAITGHKIKGSEVYLLLQLLKDVRQWTSGVYHPDSAEDCIAYSVLKAEALEIETFGGHAKCLIPSGKLPETITPETKKTGFEGVYEHVDGGQYRLLEIANLDSVDKIKWPVTAVYRNVVSNELFTRPMEDFKEKFTRM